MSGHRYLLPIEPVVSVRWDRRLWGVIFSGAKGERILIGEAWEHGGFLLAAMPGEPTRALLFTTRAAARDWCKAKMQTYEGRNDCCAKWKFMPVRVRELVDVAR